MTTVIDTTSDGHGLDKRVVPTGVGRFSGLPVAQTLSENDTVNVLGVGHQGPTADDRTAAILNQLRARPISSPVPSHCLQKALASGLVTGRETSMRFRQELARWDEHG
jgi:hypothetical protein